MTESTTLGAYLRRERERRGLALRTISENTKVSIALLDGLEGDDISRWPGGIFRRAFVRSYAKCVGLDPDDVIRRFEKQFPPEGADPAVPVDAVVAARHPVVVRSFPQRPAPAVPEIPTRSRVIGSAADLTVAVVLAFGCAAAGSRMLWPVLLIAFYYAAGVMLTGTSPMVALLSDAFLRAPTPRVPAVQATAPVPAPASASAEPAATRASARHTPRRAGDRPVRQRRGMQAPV